MAGLVTESLAKSYGATRIIDDVSLAISSGEFLTLLGPSGCGKTTLLRIIAGLTAADRGRVILDGRDLTGVEPNRRGLGMVFQAHALFPHMTVLDNVCFGLRMRGVPRAECVRRARDALALVQLGSFGHRMPRQLSGGQQQRVAIARATVFSPNLLLMDEPFGALDRRLRDALQIELRRMVRDLGITTIFVTHDQDEALVLSDRIALMQAGRIAQIGAPRDVFRRPRTRFAANFMGIENLFEARVIGRSDDAIELTCGDTRLMASATDPVDAGDRVVVGVRGEDIRLASDAGTARLNVLPGTVTDVIYRGDRWGVRVSTQVGQLTAQPASGGEAEPPATIGARVDLAWSTQATLLLAP
ncbi:MAG: ABC transporter ATP-binding protein [Acetobacteraceae bacterium]|nr:ABC transporter ATP-binding protein [Acetobacteraceae bacterium]